MRTLDRRRAPFIATIAVIVLAVTAVTAYAGKNTKTSSQRCNKKFSCSTDTLAPSISISSPSAGQIVSGTVGVSGIASDAGGLARVEVRIDGGTYVAASGTTAWSTALDLSAMSAGSHTLTARATDLAGNQSLSSVAVTVDPPSDTMVPTVSIKAPSSGSTVKGSVAMSGTASDAVAVASVSVKVDGGSYQLATGTTSWSFPLDTTALADGSHTLAARATDTSGNVAITSITVSVSNAAPSPSPSPTTDGTYSMVTPEGVSISIEGESRTHWTAPGIYDLLKANARDLAKLGPTLKVVVQDTSPSQCSTATVKLDGVYKKFYATITLQGVNSGFAKNPSATMAHEYGHAWSWYHIYLTHQGDWTSYFKARGIDGDPRIDTSYAWSRGEIIADDYRLLFGSAEAIAEWPKHMNTDIPDPRNVSGLKQFLATTWSGA